MRRAESFVFASFLVTAFAGCGGSGFAVAPVSGKVTLNGKPLADANVSFESESKAKEVGPGASAVTDAEGRYTLVAIDGRRGATVGPNQVQIHTFKLKELSPTESDMNPQQRGAQHVSVQEKVPTKYAALGALKFDVPSGGTSEANFELTGESPPPFTGLAKVPPVPLR